MKKYTLLLINILTIISVFSVCDLHAESFNDTILNAGNSAGKFDAGTLYLVADFYDCNIIDDKILKSNIVAVITAGVYKDILVTSYCLYNQHCFSIFCNNSDLFPLLL